MTYSDLWHQLLPLYDAREAQAVIRLLLDDRFQLSLTDIVCGRVETLGDADRKQLEADLQQLRQGVPVQYVLGHATFCGRTFHVEPGVLIPRPETEELCLRIVSQTNRPYCALQPPAPLRVLDVGTGSGCIAVTLALDLWNAAVTAWDISPDALLIARDNAHALQARVNFELRDILAAAPSAPATPSAPAAPASASVLPTAIAITVANPPSQPVASPPCWDLIVSNPPYIADSERTAMASTVLDHEPALALFVPDNDPLRFYRATARYARATLSPGGRLFFEINPLYAEPLRSLLASLSFTAITIADDQFARPRFCAATQP